MDLPRPRSGGENAQKISNNGDFFFLNGRGHVLYACEYMRLTESDPESDARVPHLLI